MKHPSLPSMPWRLAQVLDHVITLEPWLAATAGAPPPPGPDPLRDPPAGERGDFLRLYKAARRRVGRPLAAHAGLTLFGRLGRDDRVLITTGLVATGIPRGETDGPTGALALARALILGRKARATLLAEDAVVPVLAAGAATLAAGERDGDDWLPGLTVQGISASRSEAERECRAVWRDLRPTAVVSIEKLGPNGRGVIHNMRGQDVTATQARTDLLFGLAASARRLTVGVGDRGNEIGMGGLGGGARCQCPCGGRIACAVPADLPVVAFSSNWGAHAMIAAMAVSARMPRLLHQPQNEVRMLRRLVRAGVVDGVTRRRDPSVDGAGPALQAGIVALLHALIEAPARS